MIIDVVLKIIFADPKYFPKKLFKPITQYYLAHGLITFWEKYCYNDFLQRIVN